MELIGWVIGILLIVGLLMAYAVPEYRKQMRRYELERQQKAAEKDREDEAA